MATAHLALGSTWWAAMHWAGWIDGAVGFVLLSGLVVGMTQRRAVQRAGLPSAYRKTARRIIVLLVIHIELCFVALTVSAVDPAQSGRLPSAAAEGGWGEAVGKVLTLRINPPTSSILSLYVVMSVVGMAAVYCLRSGRPISAIVGSGMIYAAAWLFPGQTTFPERAFVPGYVNWAAWQALFVVAVTVGWHWDSAPLLRIKTSWRWLLAAAVLALGLAVVGHADVHRRAFAESPLERPLRWMFGNGKLGLGAIVFAFAACLLLYRCGQAAMRSTALAALLSPLAVLGRRSLDSYVIIAVVSLCAPAAVPYRPDRLTGALLALSVLMVCAAWALLRRILERGEHSAVTITSPTIRSARQVQS